MAKLRKIQEPCLKGIFTKWIKEKLRKWVKKEEINLRDIFGIYLYYDGDKYSIDYGICPKYSNATCDYIVGSDPFDEGGIIVENFMFGNGFNLNKYTSERNLTKVAHRIIDNYNYQVGMYEKYGVI